MIDPYKYLLNKLDVIIIPEFNTYSLYLKLETGEKLISNNVPITWTYEQIFKLYRNIASNPWFRQYHREIDSFCRQLRCFPEELESAEHVDLLLAVNGLQMSDEISC